MAGTFSWDADADVVVLGMGAAGCSAAIEAGDAGASVIVLEKMPAGREGGSTRVSGAVWFDNRDPERAATYLRQLSGDFPLPEPVIEVWTRETSRNSAWLESVGARVARCGNHRPEFGELDGSDAHGGYVGVDGQLGNGRLFEVLSRAVRERGIDVRLATPARELVTDPATRAVLGVVATSPDGLPLRVRARRGVVLATGGFEANPTMVRDYIGLPDAVTWGTPAATGDGHKMAQRAGADLWHMANMMTVCGLRAPGYESGFYVQFIHAKGFVYVGMDGTRFTDELPQSGHGHARVNGSYRLFPTQPMYVIFDEATRRAGPISPGKDVLPVGWNNLVERYDWSQDNSAEIDNGWIHRASTLTELAGLLHVEPEVLESTIHRFNAACDAGRDDQFGRDPDTLVPLREPPYYAFTWGPVLAWTNGGPRRNEKAEVLDHSGEVIGGLYAAGNVSSTYSWCKDGGFHIADALAFGRVAGRSAAARTPQAIVDPLERRVAALEATQAIKELKYQYLRAADAKDPEAFRSCFVRSGAAIDFGTLGRFGDAESLTKVFADIALREVNGKHVIRDMHHGVHPEIRVHDDRTASGRWTLRFRQVNLGEGTERVVAGEYDDTYVVEDGQWKISTSRFRARWHVTRPLTDDVKVS